MIISIVNRSKTISDEQIQTAVRAINRQIAEDFEPYWSFGATLRLEGAVGSRINKQTLADLRGDAILYLSDKADVADALGYHDSNFRGIPYGFVFTELCAQLKESWTVTLSHEAMELLADSQSNLLVQGPHPETPEREVFHWFEMCDAVQSQSYMIDGVEVSNFVLPLYFTLEEQEGGRNDFLGRLQKGKGLKSFGVSPGGYIGFYDPQTSSHITYAAPGDKKAQVRIAIKNAVQAGRGYLRKHGSAVVCKEESQQQALASSSAPKDMTASLASVVKAAGIAADPIKHVVVLMLENRSFDQMLGDATRVYPSLEGIPQTGAVYSNKSGKTGKVFKQAPDAAGKVDPDPDHEHDHVMQQLGGGAVAPMGGFIDSYLTVAKANETNAQQVMSYFPLGATPEQDSLPALHALARNFLVCDHWFSSMPGPTWPNRFFVHSGTCLGHVLMPSRQHPENFHIYDQDTIYDRLDQAKKNWRIYNDGFPQSVVMTHLLPKYLTSHYRSMDKFYKDVNDAKNFPEYVFIEPRYFSPNENDQHPPADIAAGDQLIANVYNALRKSPNWESTLLIITYDEHGGFFDHVSPPATVAPDKYTKEYAFDRLGVRVPTILISPWLDAGVCKTTFDHTSILRYLCDKYGMKPLGRRTSPEAGPLQAQSFADELRKRSTPRTDTPAAIKGRALQKGRVIAAESPVEGSREALLMFMATLPEPGADTAKKSTLRAARATATNTAVVLSDEQLRALAEEKFGKLGETAPASKKKTAKPTTEKQKAPKQKPMKKPKKKVEEITDASY